MFRYSLLRIGQLEKWVEVQYTSTVLIKASPALIQYTSPTLIQSSLTLIYSTPTLIQYISPALIQSSPALIQYIYPALILPLATCVSPWWARTPGTRHPELGPGSPPGLGPGPGARWVHSACGRPTTEPGRHGAGQVVWTTTQQTDSRSCVHLSVRGGGEGVCSSLGLQPDHLVGRVSVTLLCAGHLHRLTAPPRVPEG